ncbi:MAG TPA: hypothetical protein VNB49_07885, partial [Candidatus Dormibacteraeota bacterium]|nr:hypothetical protein [Candidatus Dormibacteraeota bacterium]
MESFTEHITKSVPMKREGLPDGSDESAVGQAAISTALAGIFRGKFCDAILPGRHATTFQKADVIYEVGDKDRVFFFLQSGF